MTLSRRELFKEKISFFIFHSVSYLISVNEFHALFNYSRSVLREKNNAINLFPDFMYIIEWHFNIEVWRR